MPCRCDLTLNSARLIAALRKQRRSTVRQQIDEGAEIGGTQSAERVLEWIGEISGRGIQVVNTAHESFPAALKHIPDPPLILYGRGRMEVLSQRCVAIVGSRRASNNGMLMARRCAETLAALGVVVVSGLASGIDSAAHEGALAAGGLTAAVLGSGLDRIYPAHNRGLAASILEHDGVLLSELEPDSPPHKRHFPERNRIISGLCDAVLVVEASLRSGSLITARMALEQGRDVFAVPGSVFSPSSQGCHRLIREGAALIDSIETLLQELGLDAQRVERGPDGPDVPDAEHRSMLANMLAKMPDGEPLSLEHLATIFERSMEETLLILLELELQGFVVTRDGGYIRVPTLP